MSSRILCAAVLLLVALAVAPASGESTTPILVELFTSEGCSSCPPADALFRTLDTTQPVPGVQLILLGEHVDYWDDLGWKDTFSSHAFTVRQGVYAQRLRLESAYTPQMVVDGTFEFVGNDRRRANQAFEKARTLPKIGVRISSVKIENGAARAHVETDSLPSNSEIFVALVLEHAESQVLRGENGGRRLEHAAVLRTLTSVGRASGGQSFSKDVDLALKFAERPDRLVVFVQELNQGRILGAVSEPIQK